MTDKFNGPFWREQMVYDSGDALAYVDGFGKYAFHVAGYPMYENTIGDEIKYTVLDGDEIVSWSLFGVLDTETHGEVYVIKSSFSNQQYKGVGITLKMISDIMRYTGKDIVSEPDLDGCGMDLWQQLKKVFTYVDVMNSSTGKRTSLLIDDAYVPASGERLFVAKVIFNRNVDLRSICKSYESMRINADIGLLNF